MAKNSSILTSFSSNHYSQNGEDGIIEKIFELIGTKSKICIEFGAWDGFHFSNTANLWTNGWKGILIEGNAEKAEVLKKNTAPYNCMAICRYVGVKKGETLEDIMRENNLRMEADLLSIDIDGDDYHVFATLNNLHPRVIICEYNPTIPHWIDIYAEPGSYFGASVSALARIGKERGYRLIAITETNCIFVCENEFAPMKNFNTNLNDIAVNYSLNFIITSYSGEYFILGKMPFGLNSRCLTRIQCDKNTFSTVESNRNILILGGKKIRALAKEYFRFLMRLF